MGSVSPSVVEFCPAKLNLFLEVHRRRTDGFHELTTVFQTIALGDTLELSMAPDLPAGAVECTVSSDGRPDLVTDVPTDGRNLAVQAVRALRDAAGRTAALRLHLTKRVPTGAGLGGGSADAAGALRAVVRLLELDTSPVDVQRIAASLGSDVPFLLVGGTALARGRGEQLQQLSALPARDVGLFVPEVALSTPDVYGALTQADFGERTSDAVLTSLRDADSDRALELSHNALWAPVARVCPQLASLRERLEARLGSPVRLTGSGSTLFALLAPEAPLPEIDRAGLRAVHRTQFAPATPFPRGGSDLDARGA